MMIAPKTYEFQSRETADLVVAALWYAGFEADKAGIEVRTDAPLTREQIVEKARNYLTLKAVRSAIEIVDAAIDTDHDTMIHWHKLYVLVDMRRPLEQEARRIPSQSFANLAEFVAFLDNPAA